MRAHLVWVAATPAGEDGDSVVVALQLGAVFADERLRDAVGVGPHVTPDHRVLGVVSVVRRVVVLVVVRRGDHDEDELADEKQDDEALDRGQRGAHTERRPAIAHSQREDGLSHLPPPHSKRNLDRSKSEYSNCIVHMPGYNIIYVL